MGLCLAKQSRCQDEYAPGMGEDLLVMLKRRKYKNTVNTYAASVGIHVLWGHSIDNCFFLDGWQRIKTL